MLISNMRKVTFTAYVSEDEAQLIEAELQYLYCNVEVALAGGFVGVEAVPEDDERGKNALQFLNDLNEDWLVEPDDSSPGSPTPLTGAP